MLARCRALGEALAALGPQGVRRIQNLRNPLLLGEGREGDLEDLQFGFVERLALCCSVYETVIIDRTKCPIQVVTISYLLVENLKCGDCLVGEEVATCKPNQGRCRENP